MIERTPNERLGQPQDIVKSVAFFESDEAGCHRRLFAASGGFWHKKSADRSTYRAFFETAARLIVAQQMEKAFWCRALFHFFREEQTPTTRFSSVLLE